MWTTPEKNMKKRETLRNANQSKTTKRAGFKVYDPPPPSQPYEMLHKTKTLTTTARQKKAKEKALK